jgi:hypothetical protein
LGIERASKRWAVLLLKLLVFCQLLNQPRGATLEPFIPWTKVSHSGVDGNVDRWEEVDGDVESWSCGAPRALLI